MGRCKCEIYINPDPQAGELSPSQMQSHVDDGRISCFTGRTTELVYDVILNLDLGGCANWHGKEAHASKQVASF